MMVQQTKQFCRNNVLIFLIYFTITAAQNITLYNYKQSDSVTSCFTGLIQERDRFVFHSDVDFKNASSDWSRIIGFQYKPPTSTDYILFCLVDLRSVCSGIDGSKCYCNYTDTNGVYHIVIDATALIAFSNSSLRGYISYNFNTTSFSSSQVIPTIYGKMAFYVVFNHEKIIATTKKF
ncbi:uncharacterized protein LOC131928573 [Physella acuta]|uniref:uncharacterized protein LOC131928573 n=1 Tax=Physella acuta TaxID=109671 RepID=UPI0027DCABB1|nr:uncharacterized protein LOC131928573 [Physella acuta]